MLAVQPELLNEQAAPPAPQGVIENLQTISLTSAHIGNIVLPVVWFFTITASVYFDSFFCLIPYHPYQFITEITASYICPCLFSWGIFNTLGYFQHIGLFSTHWVISLFSLPNSHFSQYFHLFSALLLLCSFLKKKSNTFTLSSMLVMLLKD